MRWIRKSAEPRALTQWHRRLQGNDPNYGYNLLRQDTAIVEAVVESLLAKQGWLDAYTGQRIEADGCHIEHVVPQKHCAPGQDVAYPNLVACYPPPNQGTAPYGAHPKGSWPSPEERYLFLSPLEPGCEARFRFSDRGVIAPAHSGDTAVEETIKHLKLDDPQLTHQRRKAIESELKNRSLKLEDARKRLHSLEQEQDGGKLDPYCFALKQALTRHIKRVEGMREGKAKKSA